MGAAAFIMVEFLGISYDQIIISAIIPAIAFFTGVWIMAHLEAGRVGLKSVPKSELPDWKKLVIEKWLPEHLGIPAAISHPDRQSYPFRMRAFSAL